MKIKKIFKNITLENLVYTFFSIYVITLILGDTSVVLTRDVFGVILKIIRYICYTIFFIKVFFDWKNDSNITISMICLGVLSIIISFFSKNTTVSFLFFVMLALRKMEFDKLISITFRTVLITFFIIINLSLLKIIPDWIYYRGEIVRHSLGFKYATNTVGIYLSIILMFFYTKRFNATNYELVILETINVFLYSYTNGRLSFILISIILFSLFLAKFKFIRKCFASKKVQNLIKIMCFSLPMILFITFNLFVYLYGNNNSLAVKLDKMLSGRIKYTYQSYEDYGITLFGQDIDWKGWGGHGYIDTEDIEEFKYSYVDSSYARIMFDYGIIFTIIVLIGYTIVLIENYKFKNYWIIFTLFFVLIWSLIEQHLVNIYINLFVLTLIPLFELGKIKFLNYNNIKLKIKRVKNEKINN